jgi:hypothetical protein
MHTGRHFPPRHPRHCFTMSDGSTFTCESAPAACGGAASCDCLASVAVASVGTCLSTMDGGILMARQKG